MNKHIALIFISLGMFACGQEQAPAVVDEQLAPYITELQAQAAKYGSAMDLTGYEVKIVPSIGNNVIAQCAQPSDPDSDAAREISVSQTYFDQFVAQAELDSSYRLSGLTSYGLSMALYLTLLHEIGHCYFRRDHDNTKVNNVPASSMNAYASHSWVRIYPSLLDAYNRNMFGQADAVALVTAALSNDAVASVDQALSIDEAIEQAMNEEGIMLDAHDHE